MANLSPFSDFQNLTPGQLATLQVKLTFIGGQRKGVQTVAFTSPSNTVDLTKFIPFRRQGINYSNDDAPPRVFGASASELQAVIVAVGKVPAVVAGGVASQPYLAFGMFDTIGGVDKAFEAVLNVSDGTTVLQAVRTAIPANKDGSRAVNDFGCTTALREPGQPVDVTSKVTLVFGGLRLNRTTGHFVSTATFKNNSSDVIPGPVSLVLLLPSEGNTLRLFNADGYTCGTSPEGVDFINLPLTGNQLNPGASGQVNLVFDNPNAAEIAPQAKVLAGPGAR